MRKFDQLHMLHMQIDRDAKRYKRQANEEGNDPKTEEFCFKAATALFHVRNEVDFEIKKVLAGERE